MFFPIAYQLTHGFVDFQIFGCSQTVGKEFAIQVIQVMLDAAAEQTAAFALDDLTVEGRGTEKNALRPDDRGENVRYAQASFGVFRKPPGCGENFRIDDRQRHENRSDKWAIQMLIPVEALDDAIAEGCTEVWELAERFQVTEEFVRKAVCFYVHGNVAEELYF